MKNLMYRISFHAKRNAWLLVVIGLTAITLGFMGYTFQAFVAAGLGIYIVSASTNFFTNPLESVTEEDGKVKKFAAAILEYATRNSVVSSLGVAVGVFNSFSIPLGVSFETLWFSLLAGIGTKTIIEYCWPKTALESLETAEGDYNGKPIEELQEQDAYAR